MLGVGRFVYDGTLSDINSLQPGHSGLASPSTLNFPAGIPSYDCIVFCFGDENAQMNILGRLNVVCIRTKVYGSWGSWNGL